MLSIMVPKPEGVTWKNHLHLLERGGCYLYLIILEKEDTKAQFSESLLKPSSSSGSHHSEMHHFPAGSIWHMFVCFMMCLYIIWYVVKIPSLASHTTL